MTKLRKEWREAVEEWHNTPWGTPDSLALRLQELADAERREGMTKAFEAGRQKKKVPDRGYEWQYLYDEATDYLNSLKEDR